jgi:hypothetical protein
MTLAEWADLRPVRPLHIDRRQMWGRTALWRKCTGSRFPQGLTCYELRTAGQ